ncbi:hypothetical protein SAMN05660297_03212 [Natronincola peptidivorans]|uniref:Uncharacterized protein n=1 Tax=Natronincola peptidivorans TaxID=426128 RepID=A0A1I0GJW0_9FIRM|nr:hypothetical protein [Natronincola peptidivorans]SET70441.1 hypothetical protein SAMN05660297_03212 [Natronincola peptidivorans]
MGMPEIPDMKPKIDLKKEDMINMLLASIALEEMSLAHILNAEGEKIQCITDDKRKCKLDDLLDINESVNETLRNVIKKEMLLQFKLENVMKMMDKKKPKKCVDDC